MANPFDDLIPGGAAPKGGTFDDLIPAKPQGRDWRGLAGDVAAYGATPFMPLVLAARQGVLGGDAKEFVGGDRRLERLIALGASDAVADAAGMPADLAAAGLRQVGVPANYPLGGSRMNRDVIDYVGTAGGRVVDAISQRSLDPLTEPRTARLDPQDRPERLAYGFGKGAGGAATFFAPAGMIAQAAPVGSVTQGVAKTLAARPATQAIVGGAGGAVTEETKNPWYGMATSLGLAGAKDAAAGGLRRLATPTVRLTPDEQQIVQTMVARGIPVTPGQASGSRGLNLFEQTARRLPVAGNIMDNTFDQQRQALTREITQLAGGAANRAGPGVMDNLYRTAATNFDDLIAQQGHVQFNQAFPNSIARVAQDYGRRLGTDVRAAFQSYVDDLMPLAQAAHAGRNPRVDAQWYQNVRSDLTTAARETKDAPYRRALLGLRDALDDQAAATRPDLADRWQTVRTQYRNLSILDDAMSKAPAADASKGDVPLDAFRRAVKRSDPEGYSRGRGGDMNELARIAGFLQPRVPNSGTPERSIMSAGLMGGAFAEPMTAATAVGIPTLLSAAYNSQPVRQMLSTRPAPMMQGTGGVVEALMLQQLRDQLGGALVPR